MNDLYFDLLLKYVIISIMTVKEGDYNEENIIFDTDMSVSFVIFVCWIHISFY